MSAAAFPSLAQIARVIKAAEKAGLEVGGVRVESNGSVLIFASGAPLLAYNAPPSEDEPNQFD